MKLNKPNATNKRSLRPQLLFVIGFASLLCLCACEEEEDFLSPKPRGYFRIDFPEKNYKPYDSLCPFRFEVPAYSEVVPNTQKNAEPCWQNIEFKRFKATLYLSYKPVNNNLPKYLDDAHEFANRHQIKANGLEQIAIVRDSAKVYGLLFDISGNTASSVQFYLTDSTQHFLRGSLYFNCTPNADSLKKVIDFLKQDILHLINTTAWKNTEKIS
ncbi:MAG: gliding motility lipoprotein GldD [Bacteroidia bacterium]|nr:gliding motility lipoprotein GldD [Bacteroidia bacterium]